MEWREEDPAFVTALVEQMWQNAGATVEHAAAVARAVVGGELLGKHVQGISVLEILYPSLRDKTIDLTAVPEVVDEGDVWFVLDGKMSSGFYVMDLAIKRAIQKARTNGICLGMCRNHWDAGCFGVYALQAADAGMLALTTNTTPPEATPIGGMRNVMSVAPLTVAAPASEALPVLVDVMTTETYDGDLVAEALEGRRHRQAVLVDPVTGDLTDDPAPYMVPFEGDFARHASFTCGITFASHRLQSINIITELLCALVPGGLITPDLPLPAEVDPNDPVEMTSVPASIVLVIDPAKFGAGDEYREKIDRYVAAVKGVKRRPGAEDIRMPGEAGIRRAREYQNLRVRNSHWEPFVSWCAEFNVDVDAEREAFFGRQSA